MLTKYLRSVLGGTVAFLLLAFYLIPHTSISDFSPWTYFQWARTGSVEPVVLAVEAISCTAVVVGVLLLGKQNHAPKTLAIAITFYTCAVAICALTSLGNIGTANECVSVLLALATGSLAARLIPTDGGRIATVLLVAVIEGGWALWLRRQGINTIQSGDLVRGGGTFDNPNHLFTLSATVIPLGLAAAIGAKASWKYMGISVGVAVAVAALVCTWSRGGFIAASAGCLVVAWHFTRTNRKAMIPIAVVVAGFISLSFLTRTSGPVNAASTSRSNLGRAYVARMGLQEWQKNPILGSGIGSTRIKITWPAELADHRPKVESLVDPRSLPLLWLIEMGIPGIAIFFALLYGTAEVARRSVTAEQVALSGAFTALVCSGILDVTFGSIYHNPGNVLLGFLASSVSLSTFNLKPKDAISPPEAPSPALSPLLEHTEAVDGWPRGQIEETWESP